MNPTRVAALALAAVVLVACGRKPEPPPQLPRLERPVITLQMPAAKTPDALPGILVPRATYAERAGIPGVFVLHDGLARFRMVKAGRVRGTDIEILSGLHGTETLVLGDLQDVRDGSPIKTVETADKRR